MNKKFLIKIAILFLILNVFCAACSISKRTYKTFVTSFESVDDFKSFYIVPQNYIGTASHDLSTEEVHSGTYAHRGWVYGTNPPSTITQNNNHRGYPTIQFQKTKDGVFRTPCYVTLWVWLDVALKPGTGENEWFSFATFTSDTSDAWSRTVLVNLSYDGYVHLMHVPVQGKGDHIFQTDSIIFPQKTWVKLKIYLDLDPQKGYAKVWQDEQLVSYAEIRGCNGTLAQAHFGLYAPPSLSSGIIYNDDLEIREVDAE